MKTYSVKQIAEMLNTNPETVRRWIRDEKLKAVQVSRKDGNVITDAELQRFLKATPKYIPKFTAGLTAISPAVGIATLAGSIVAGVVMGYLEEKSEVDVRVLPEDFKKYLQTSIEKIQKTVVQKQALINQTQTEISELEKRAEQYNYLLEHEDVLQNAIGKVATTEKAEKE